MAISANKEMHEARMRMNSHDLGVPNPPVSARQAWPDVEESTFSNQHVQVNTQVWDNAFFKYLIQFPKKL